MNRLHSKLVDNIGKSLEISYFQTPPKPVNRVLWLNPAMGILKQNFDGSFVHSLRRGGIGDVIRDWSSKVVRSYSGPVESMDVNEAERFALLISCHEVRRMGCVNVILEGNAFSVIEFW